jgi:hypothetical protein
LRQQRRAALPPHKRDERMNDSEWLEQKDDALEKLLVERWLFRGVLLVVMMTAAVLTTYVGMQGLHTIVDRVTVGALVGLTVSAGAGVFMMRNKDIRIHRELRRRRG